MKFNLISPFIGLGSENLFIEFYKIRLSIVRKNKRKNKKCTSIKGFKIGICKIFKKQKTNKQLKKLISVYLSFDYWICKKWIY